MLLAGLAQGADRGENRALRVWTDDTSERAIQVLDLDGLAAPGTVQSIPLPPILLQPEIAGMFPRRLFEVAGLHPDTIYRIRLGEEETTVRTLPDSENELNLVLGSCFWQDGDRGRLWRGAQKLLHPLDFPHLKILCGDQIYLDEPTFGFLGMGVSAKEGTRERYQRYWEDDSYGNFLRLGCSVFTPDDHEVWNDYPFNPFWLSRTWTRSKREKHREYALAGLAAHQTLTNPAAQSWFNVDLGPVSLFVTDIRSQRTKQSLFGDGATGENQRKALEAWGGSLTKPGFLVLSQPLFQDPESRQFGITTDHNILYFKDDARFLWNLVEQAPHDIVTLAGDIHLSRSVSWSSPKGRLCHEIVSSPLSLLGSNYPDRPIEAPPEVYPDEQVRRATTHYATRNNSFAFVRITPEEGGVLVCAESRQLPSSIVAASMLEDRRACSYSFRIR